ncbi:MAG: DUF1015 domain-containing protein [Bacilli bacterium]
MSFTTIRVPHILLPKKGTDMTAYAVIACDQFTSQKKYWDDLKQMIGDKPSTFHMIFPEAYLESFDNKQYIKEINKNIEQYLANGILEDIGPCFILVERTTAYNTRRLGLILAIDLEDYSYKRGTKCSIKASEATIEERIPPRLEIRQDAPIELPHTLLLFDDPNKTIVEPLYEKKMSLPLLYDFDLNQNGGHIRGYKIEDTKTIIDLFEQLCIKNNNGLNFIVGDGNHSLATAKAHWEKLKVQLSPREQENHPARFALVEANNVYDEGINFEPIHRIIYHVDPNFEKKLQKLCDGPSRECYIFDKINGKKVIKTPLNVANTYKIIQTFIDEYLQNNPQSSVDYIHDESSLLNIAKQKSNSVAIKMPALGKNDIFAFVSQDAVLPRKSFSMGHASEKRYYLEAKSIRG